MTLSLGMGLQTLNEKVRGGGEIGKYYQRLLSSSNFLYWYTIRVSITIFNNNLTSFYRHLSVILSLS